MAIKPVDVHGHNQFCIPQLRISQPVRHTTAATPQPSLHAQHSLQPLPALPTRIIMRSVVLGAALLVLSMTDAAAIKQRSTYSFRWKGFCIEGAPLAAADTDKAHLDLLNWVSPNGIGLDTTDHNLYHPYTRNQAMVYACTDAHDAKHQKFTPTDIQTAFAAMDANCAPYQPSWAILEMSDTGSTWKATSKIVGKSWVGTPVCQGHNGGMAKGDSTDGNVIFTGDEYDITWV